jgi:DNA invertase Pin-like site-specific DNA recombinase
MKVVAYTRCSTDEQHPENQRADIELLAKSRGWVVSKWIEEKESGYKPGQQYELYDFIRDLKNGNRRFDYLIVWSLDRLTREGTLKQFSYLYTLSQYGCTLLSCREPWVEANDLTRDILLTVAAYMAKAESQRRSERIKAGNARVLKDGVTKTGRAITKLGRLPGAKDKASKPRHTAGYLRRYARNTNKLPPENEDILSVESLTK